MNEETKPQLIVPALGGLYEKLAPFGYPLIRIVAGLWLIPHGLQKFGALGGDPSMLTGYFAQIGLEPAQVMVNLAASVEVFGGILIALGLFTRPAAAAAFVLLAVAIAKVHIGAGFFVINGGFEYAMMWAVLMVAILFKGAGRFSVDRRFGHEF